MDSVGEVKSELPGLKKNGSQKKPAEKIQMSRPHWQCQKKRTKLGGAEVNVTRRDAQISKLPGPQNANGQELKIRTSTTLKLKLRQKEWDCRDIAASGKEVCLVVQN